MRVTFSGRQRNSTMKLYPSDTAAVMMNGAAEGERWKRRAGTEDRELDSRSAALDSYQHQPTTPCSLLSRASPRRTSCGPLPPCAPIFLAPTSPTTPKLPPLPAPMTSLPSPIRRFDDSQPV